MRFRRRRAETDRCVCGHTREAHEHLRRGTDCALCQRGGCERFRRAAHQPGSDKRARG